MVKNAIFSFYQAGDIPQAQKIYDQLKKLYPEKGTNVPLVTFVRRRLDEELTSIGLNNANEIVQMMLRESYFRYAIRDDDAAFAREKMAKEIHDHYQSAYLPENRIDLPELKLLKYLALLDFLNDQRYPRQLRLGLIGRIKIERPELAEQFSRQEEKMLKELEQSQQQP